MGKTKITAPAGTPFVDIEREFDAPRELVYKAYADPALITQWLGPRKYEMVLDRWDMRAGGGYRYVHQDDQGNAFGFHGVFHSVEIDNMVQTFEFEGVPGHVSMDALVIEDLGGGRSRVRSHTVFQSIEDRDQMVGAGMSTGVEEGYERLDEVLAKLREPVAAG